MAFHLVGGPLDGQVVALDASATHVKILVQDPEQNPWTGGPSIVPTHVEFYIRKGRGSVMEYQPHPH